MKFIEQCSCGASLELNGYAQDQLTTERALEVLAEWRGDHLCFDDVTEELAQINEELEEAVKGLEQVAYPKFMYQFADGEMVQGFFAEQLPEYVETVREKGRVYDGGAELNEAINAVRLQSAKMPEPRLGRRTSFEIEDA